MDDGSTHVGPHSLHSLRVVAVPLGSVVVVAVLPCAPVSTPSSCVPYWSYCPCPRSSPPGGQPPSPACRIFPRRMPHTYRRHAPRTPGEVPSPDLADGDDWFPFLTTMSASLLRSPPHDSERMMALMHRKVLPQPRAKLMPQSWISRATSRSGFSNSVKSTSSTSHLSSSPTLMTPWDRYALIGFCLGFLGLGMLTLNLAVDE